MSIITESPADGISGCERLMAEFGIKPALPSLADLIDTVRTSPSPKEREFAVRAAYLMGGVHALEGKANATYAKAVVS